MHEELMELEKPRPKKKSHLAVIVDHYCYNSPAHTIGKKNHATLQVDQRNMCFFSFWMFPKILGFSSPNHPILLRVFHYFHQPFWGFYPLFLEAPGSNDVQA